MSHWHRAPRAVSVRSLIQRSTRSILVDWSVDVSCHKGVKEISKEVEVIRDLDPAEKLTRVQIAQLCQQMHGLLLTTDSEMIPMLISECRAPWGAMLLSEGRLAQADVLDRLAANELFVQPAGDQGILTECADQNTILIDVRQSRPTIGVFLNCRWSPKER